LVELGRIHIHIDGASRGNPGEAGIGIVLRDDAGNIIKRYNEYIGIKTNNEAEYMALKKGLELALNYCRKHVTILSDSELLVRQRRRQYKTKKKHLKSLANEVQALEEMFEIVEYQNVPRGQNREADKLANKAIDGSTLK
jgi:ribonuclease HI